jgi:glycosyltransferase involved in cell wall biosynthesis
MHSKPNFPVKISVVTATLNQRTFIEEAICSVLDQNYPNFEYIIIDGGSKDGTLEVIDRYSDRLACFISEPDSGHYNAINKGFNHSTGDVMGWLNSDDKYTPWALSVVGEIFSNFPEVEWLTSLNPLTWDSDGRAVACGSSLAFSRDGFFRGENLPTGRWHGRNWIQQESTFWRRTLWERAGGRLNEEYSLAADFELWARFYKSAELYAVGTPLGGFRMHCAQKTANHMDAYLAEAKTAFLIHGGHFAGGFRNFLDRKLFKLISKLEKIYSSRLSEIPTANTIFHTGRNGHWSFKKVP